MRNVGFETLTVGASAVGITSSVLNPSSGQADYAFFGPLETQQIRWRDDGTAPTSSVGHLMETGQVMEYSGDLSAIKFIKTGGSDAALPLTVYQQG